MHIFGCILRLTTRIVGHNKRAEIMMISIKNYFLVYNNTSLRRGVDVNSGRPNILRCRELKMDGAGSKCCCEGKQIN